MKKILYSVMVLALTATAFTSCEDVPAPYSINYEEKGNPTTPTNNAVNTEATAFTVAEAVQKIAASNGGTTTAYVKGIISEVTSFNSTYGSITYYISDNGTDKTLQIFSGLNTAKAKFAAQTDLNVGDTVVVLGDLKAYTNKAGTVINEMDKNSQIVSIKKNTTPPATDLNTKETAWTTTEAVQKINNGTTGKAYVKGTISSDPTFNSKYGSYTYYLSDNGTDQALQVFSGLNVGGAKFTGNELQKGMVVIVKGDIKKYTKTDGTSIPEIDKNNEIVEIISGGTTPTPPISTELNEISASSALVQATEMGFTDKKPATAIKTSDGVTITFGKGSGSSAPTYYAGTYASVRMYANNTIKIEAAKKITKIVIVTSSPFTKDGKTTYYNANAEAYAEGDGTKVTVVKDSDTQITFTGLNSETVTITNAFTSNSGGIQLRLVSIAVTYAN